ncbi:MAG: hypothetical protein NZ736_01850 [Candidatus Poseidoniaceae archaeon]|nr:hypothetical protein [Candidatus Poseidoniaceae archaeon]
MARKKSEEEDVHQFSLDAFLVPENDEHIEDSNESNVLASMAKSSSDNPEDESSVDETTESPIVELNPLRSFDMPSSQASVARTTPKTKLIFHDLEKMYPNPPMKDEANGLVIHRAVLHDLTGVGQVMDWLSDDHGAIIEMSRLMKREVEFTTALAQLNQFIEGDLGGQIIQITESRLMFLPPGCRGVKGVDMEAFAADTDDLGQRRL